HATANRACLSHLPVVRGSVGVSFLEAGDAPIRSQKRLKDLNGLAGLGGTPFRASEAHRLPKSGRYVSTGWGEVKAYKAEISRFSAFPTRVPSSPSCACDPPPQISAPAPSPH